MGTGVAGPFLTLKSKLCVCSDESLGLGGSSRAHQLALLGFELGKEKDFAEEKWRAAGSASDKRLLLPPQGCPCLSPCATSAGRGQNPSPGHVAGCQPPRGSSPLSSRPAEVSTAPPGPLYVAYEGDKAPASAPFTSDERGTHFSCCRSVTLSIRAVPVRSTVLRPGPFISREDWR